MKKILTLITLAIAINATLPSCSDGDSNTSSITPSYITKSDKIRIDIPFKKASDTLIQFTTSVFDVWNQFPELSPYKSVRNKITDFGVDSITIQVSGLTGTATNTAATIISGYILVASDMGHTYGIGLTSGYSYYNPNFNPAAAPVLGDLSNAVSFYRLGQMLSIKGANYEIAVGGNDILSVEVSQLPLDCSNMRGAGVDSSCVKNFYAYFAKDMLTINKATFTNNLSIQKNNTLTSGTLSIRVYYHGKFPVGV